MPGALQLEVCYRVCSFRRTEVVRVIEIARDVDEDFHLAEGQPLSQEISFPPCSQGTRGIMASIQVGYASVIVRCNHPSFHRFNLICMNNPSNKQFGLIR